MATEQAESKGRVPVRRGDTADRDELEEERHIAPFAGMGRWMDEMRHDLESWMGGVFRGPGLLGNDRFQTPRVDVADLGDHYEVLADLPGIPKDKIEVTTNDHRLELRASAETDEEEQGRTYRYREIGRRAYYRSLPLPQDADAEHAEATLEAGCLVITLPKKEFEERGRRIPVR